MITNEGKMSAKWYGAGSCKWKALLKHSKLLPINTNDTFVRAVYEWIMSEYEYRNNSSNILLINYKDLIENTAIIDSKIQTFTNGYFTLNL